MEQERRKQAETRHGVDAVVESLAKLDVNESSPDAAAPPGAAVIDDKIWINHAPYKENHVKRVIMVESLLKEKCIVIVGEGNFTFTVALAAIRKSWDGIVSTCYESVSILYPRPQFDKVQEECIEFCCKNGRMLGSDEDTIKDYIKAVKQVESPPEEAWQFGIDATATPDGLAIQGKVVIFQCPWKAEGDPTGTPATLIKNFLFHMSIKQNEGDYVLIGITKYFPYVTNYNLEDLLGEGLSRGRDSSGTYDFLGADDSFILEILKHGYRHTACDHQSGTDIHEGIIADHITLVFKRNATIIIPPVVPQPNT